MDETLTSAPPSAVSTPASFSALAAAPVAKTSMTSSVSDQPAQASQVAVETGLQAATSLRDVPGQVDLAQMYGNIDVSNAIAGEQRHIYTSIPVVPLAEPAVRDAVMESALTANQALWDTREVLLKGLTPELTAAQAAAQYDAIAKVKVESSPAMTMSPGKSEDVHTFSGGTSLDEFIELPQKPGPSGITALNAELAGLMVASDVAANTTATVYRTVPVADMVAAEISSTIPVSQPVAEVAALAEAKPTVLYNSGVLDNARLEGAVLSAAPAEQTTARVAAFTPAAIADATFIQPVAKFALADASFTQAETKFAALPDATNTTSLAYRMPEEATVLYDSGKYDFSRPTASLSASLLKALKIPNTDAIGSIEAVQRDAKFIDVTDLLAAESGRKTSINQSATGQILAHNPPSMLQLTSSASRDADALFTAPRQTAEMQPVATPSRQPRGGIQHGPSAPGSSR